MLIKYQALSAQLDKKSYPLYLLVGSEPYFLNESALLIKNQWRSQNHNEGDEKTIHLQRVEDWDFFSQTVNSYGLFHEQTLVTAYYDKKTLDKQAKETLNQYLSSNPTKSTVILYINTASIKQIEWLQQHPSVLIVQVFSLAENAWKSWIIEQLRKHAIQYQAGVPELIYEYTKGNMLACAQTIEKITLVYEKNVPLTLETTKSQLSNQCEFQLYELTDACLGQGSEKSIQLLRSLAHHTEPSLILWMLAQEIRQLIQLKHLTTQYPLAAACQQLKIWPKRVPFYTAALKRHTPASLHQLLKSAQQIDESIKTNQTKQIWNQLENVALHLAL